MFEIYADDLRIYNDAFAVPEEMVINPTLTLEANGNGSLTLTLESTNVGYSSILLMKTLIRVYREKRCIFEGRVLNDKYNYNNERELNVEGTFSWLNDVIPGQFALTSGGELIENPTPEQCITAIFGLYNSPEYNQNINRTDANYRINLSTRPIDVEWADDYVSQGESEEKPNTFTMDYSNCMDALSGVLGNCKKGSNIIVQYDGYDGNITKTVYVLPKDVGIRDSNQLIEFGNNLLDYAKDYDMTDYCTCLVPTGNGESDAEEVEGLSPKLSAAESDLVVPGYHTAGSMYITLPNNLIGDRPHVQKTISWDNVDDADELVRKAVAYLQNNQFDELHLEISAADMHYMNSSLNEIRIGDVIRVLSRPHGLLGDVTPDGTYLGKPFVVTKLEIDLDQPDNTKVTLGSYSNKGVSSQSSTAVENLNKTTKQTSYELRQARIEAAQALANATNGIVTIIKGQAGSEAIVISQTADLTQPQNYWVWNSGGLGYVANDSYPPRTTSEIVTAITNTGLIVANRVATGIFSASGPTYSFSFNADTGAFRIVSNKVTLDTNGNAEFAGELKAASGTFKGTVSAGAIQGGTIDIGNFHVTANGYVYYGDSLGSLSNALTLDSSGHLYSSQANLNNPVTAGIISIKNNPTDSEAIGAINPSSGGGWEIGGINKLNLTGSQVLINGYDVIAAFGNVYTKSQTYSKEEVNTAFGNVYTKSQTYTKEEVNWAFGNVYTKAEADAKFATK